MAVSSFAYSNGYYDAVVRKNNRNLPDLAIYDNDVWFKRNEILEFNGNYHLNSDCAYYKNKEGREMIIRVKDLIPIKTNKRSL